MCPFFALCALILGLLKTMKNVRVSYMKSLDAKCWARESSPFCRPRGPLVAIAFGSKWRKPCVWQFYHEIWGDYGKGLAHPPLRRCTRKIMIHLWIYTYLRILGTIYWDKHWPFLFLGQWKHQGNAPVATLAGHPGKIARIQTCGNMFWEWVNTFKAQRTAVFGDVSC